jgi:hypothetical protein
VLSKPDEFIPRQVPLLLINNRKELRSHFFYIPQPTGEAATELTAFGFPHSSSAIKEKVDAISAAIALEQVMVNAL